MPTFSTKSRLVEHYYASTWKKASHVPPKWINFYTALRNGASSSIGYLTEFHYQKDFIEFFSYFLVITFKENLQIWGLEPETNQLQ